MGHFLRWTRFSKDFYRLWALNSIPGRHYLFFNISQLLFILSVFTRLQGYVAHISDICIGGAASNNFSNIMTQSCPLQAAVLTTAGWIPIQFWIFHLAITLSLLFLQRLWHYSMMTSFSHHLWVRPFKTDISIRQWTMKQIIFKYLKLHSLSAKTMLGVRLGSAWNWPGWIISTYNTSGLKNVFGFDEKKIWFWLW